MAHGLLYRAVSLRGTIDTICSRQLQHGNLFPAEDHCDTLGSDFVHGKAMYVLLLLAKDM
jgi:hypothetical protein